MSGSIHHVGIIADGNRRWARHNQIPFSVAYAFAMQRVLALLHHTFQSGADLISLYLLSKENLARPSSDLEAVISAETEFVSKSLYHYCLDSGINVRHAGDADLLPTQFQRAISTLCATTSSTSKKGLNLLIGYCPWDELLHAQREARSPQELRAHLWVPEPVDVVVRTAGSDFALLSNFLPLQCGYAHIYMLDMHFPDLTAADLDSVFERHRSLNQPRGQ